MLVKFNQAMLCWVTQEFRLRRVRLDPIKRFSLGKDLEKSAKKFRGENQVR
jgi:hypothetical protein